MSSTQFVAGVTYIPVQWAQDVNTMVYQNGGGIRPTVPILYQSFFDTNLGQPIWCTQLSPAIWVNSAGAAV